MIVLKIQFCVPAPTLPEQEGEGGTSFLFFAKIKKDVPFPGFIAVIQKLTANG